MQKLQQDIRPLRSDELDAVTGGTIKMSSIIVMLPGQPKPFEDVFAPKLPSWVRRMSI